MMESNPNAASSPMLGNRYQLQTALGTGGMAMVYLAQDLMLERPVAIKILRQSFSRNSSFRELFRQEAKAAANLSHPNIVTVHDFGFDHDRLYIVMEYVPGTDLKTMIREVGRFSVDEAIPLVVQACAGIGYAHRAGLVHCDVKPHNMLVTPDQRLKVTDFGIARALSTIQPDERSDVVWGSPQYFSPEQAAGAAPSPASDVYAIGVILYEMLTGRLPFTHEDPSELARLHREQMPMPPRSLNPNISPDLDRIIMKVLAKEPAGRYRTTDQLGRILLSFSHRADPYAANMPGYPNQQAVISTRPAPPPQPAPEPGTTPPPGRSSSGATPRPTVAIRERTSLPTVSAIPAIAESPEEELETSPSGIDWLTIGLGLAAALLVGGLIPFWMYIWLSLTSN